MLRVFASVSILWLGMLAGAGLTFLTQILLARSLSLSEYGSLAAALSLVNVLAPLASFGAGGYLLRQFGREGWAAKRWVVPIIWWTVFSNIFCISAILVFSYFALQANEVNNLIVWLLPILVMQTFFSIAVTRLQLEEKYSILSFWQNIPQLTRFSVAVVVFLCGYGIYAVKLGYCLTSVFATLLCVYFSLPLIFGIHKRSKPVSMSEFKKPNFFSVGIESIPFALSGFFGLIYIQSVIFLLSVLVDNESTGIYNVAFSVMAAVYLLPTAIFNQYLLPKFHRWSEHDRERFLEVYRFGNGAMLLMGILVMGTLMSLAPFGIPLLFGEKFAASTAVLYILACSIPMRYLAACVGGVLSTQKHMRRKVFYQGIVVLVNLILSVLLIAWKNIHGAAFAILTSEILLLLLYLYGVRRHVFGPAAWKGWHLNLSRIRG